MRIFEQMLVTSLLIFSALSFTAEAAPEYRYHICRNDTTFTLNSTYKSNLDILFSSLASNAAVERLFYNTSVGRAPNIVYGSVLCRGDLLAGECKTCVEIAVTNIAQRSCPVEREAMIWYDHCTLHYSDEPFFGVRYDVPLIPLVNTGSINDTERFNRVLTSAMNESVNEAVRDSRRFATTKEVLTPLQTLYTLVQCTTDLSASDCNRCLRGTVAVLPECCSSAQGANIMTPSCNIRYEIYPFYNIAASPPDRSPEFSPPPPSSPPIRGDGKLSPVIIASICVSVVVVLLLIPIGYYCLKRKEKGGRVDYNVVPDDRSAGNEITTVESLQYDFGTVQAATNNFSDDNKIGEGGFGAVYKGVMTNGQEIAVKRLSRTSLQGEEEFKNEVVLVANLHHRNLARLLGFCLEGEEKLLIYEFVQNKSLDNFLFDDLGDQEPLDWGRRYKIIGGIARGILYLHEDSRLRIIHRDLKANNVLLDEQMNPKISDFGLAKICGVDQTQGNTSRIVGTYGYMSPEYAFYGQFSVKSDIFSFGVLLIEIITGQKCTRFIGSETVSEDLLSFAWRHWRDGTLRDLIDPRLGENYMVSEVARCIHIGLLCVQEDPAERPTMATVVLMLSSHSVTLALPQQPPFFPHFRTQEGMMPRESEKSSTKSITINEMSVSEIFPR